METLYKRSIFGIIQEFKNPLIMCLDSYQVTDAQYFVFTYFIFV